MMPMANIRTVQDRCGALLRIDGTTLGLFDGSSGWITISTSAQGLFQSIDSGGSVVAYLWENQEFFQYVGTAYQPQWHSLGAANQVAEDYWAGVLFGEWMPSGLYLLRRSTGEAPSTSGYLEHGYVRGIYQAVDGSNLIALQLVDSTIMRFDPNQSQPIRIPVYDNVDTFAIDSNYTAYVLSEVDSSDQRRASFTLYRVTPPTAQRSSWIPITPSGILSFHFDPASGYGYILADESILYRGQPSWASRSDWTPITPTGISCFDLDSIGNGYILYLPDHRLKRAIVSWAGQADWAPITPADRACTSFGLDGPDKRIIWMTYDNTLHRGDGPNVAENSWSRIRLRGNDIDSDFFPCGVYIPWTHLVNVSVVAQRTWPNPEGVLEERLDDLMAHHVNLLWVRNGPNDSESIALLCELAARRGIRVLVEPASFWNYERSWSTWNIAKLNRVTNHTYGRGKPAPLAFILADEPENLGAPAEINAIVNRFADHTSRMDAQPCRAIPATLVTRDRATHFAQVPWVEFLTHNVYEHTTQHTTDQFKEAYTRDVQSFVVQCKNIGIRPWIMPQAFARTFAIETMPAVESIHWQCEEAIRLQAEGIVFYAYTSRNADPGQICLTNGQNWTATAQYEALADAYRRIQSERSCRF
ncbi:MAG: hypothetical protein AABP62_25290 [Planctomycetota bacterium]